MPLVFDEEKLVLSLDQMEVTRRSAFAAACAERLFPGYAAYMLPDGKGDVALLRNVLDNLWKRIATTESVATPIDDDLALAGSKLLEKEDEDYRFAAAEDAAAAIFYAISSLKSAKSNDAAWAARRAYEAIDEYVAQQDDNPGFDEQRIISNELFQRELAIQNEDAANLHDPKYLASDVMQKAKVEAQGFLPWFANQ